VNTRIHPFYSARQSVRTCVGCGITLARWQPAHHRLCRTCNTYSAFKRVALAMREVRS
jgi:hypothetical protein